MARRERSKREDKVEVPGWIVTYGDMMSLLLCFFVLLLSFSTISEEAFNEALASLQGAFGVLEKYDGIISPVPRRPRKTTADIERMARELQRQMQVLDKDTDVEVRFDEEGGLKISLPSNILFESASATLKPQAYPVLNELAEVLKDVADAFIEVRGHTDDRPLAGHGRYRDNYELSYKRAEAIWRRLTEVGGVASHRFEIVACGPSQPVSTNDTQEGRQANRRVEIYVRGAFNRGRIEELRDKAESLSQMRLPGAATQ